MTRETGGILDELRAQVYSVHAFQHTSKKNSTKSKHSKETVLSYMLFSFSPVTGDPKFTNRTRISKLGLIIHG